VKAASVARHAVRRLLPPAVRIQIRSWLEDNPIVRGRHRELDIIERELKRSSGEWSAFANRAETVGLIERVVEIPWVLSRYRGERRALDVGPAYAIPLYIRQLLALHIPELHGLDLSARPVRGFIMAQADVRRMPYQDGFFDLITCISTLEHIGADNRRYEIAPAVSVDGDLAALCEMRRVLRPGGRILVTVPFGRLRRHDWFKEYDLPAWTELVERAALRTQELAVYGHQPGGWTQLADPARMASGGYAEGGAPAATAVLCAALTRPPPNSQPSA